MALGSRFQWKDQGEMPNTMFGISENGAKYTVGPWLTYDSKKEIRTGDHAEAANALLKDDNNANFEILSVAQL